MFKKMSPIPRSFANRGNPIPVPPPRSRAQRDKLVGPFVHTLADRLGSWRLLWLWGRTLSIQVPKSSMEFNLFILFLLDNQSPSSSVRRGFDHCCQVLKGGRNRAIWALCAIVRFFRSKIFTFFAPLDADAFVAY